MRTPGLALSLLLLVAAPAQAAAPTLQTVARCLQLPYSGELVIDGKTVLKFIHGAGDRRRQEVISPAALAGELVVDDGRTRFHYSPRTGKVDIAPSAVALRTVGDTERLLRKNFRLVLGPKCMVSGHLAEQVDLVPLHRARPHQRMWFAMPSGLPVRVERMDAAGARLETSEFRTIAVQEHLPADNFVFALPPGAQVSTEVRILASGAALKDLKSEFPFKPNLAPHLPAGYEVQDVHLIESRGVRSIHWRITDGLDIISLFQAARGLQPPAPPGAAPLRLPNTTGFVVERGHTRMVCWENPQGTFTLVGDLPTEELLGMVAASQP